MLYLIKLNNIPNQETSFNILTSKGIVSFDIKLRTLLDDSLIMDLKINQEIIFLGKVVIDKMPLIYNNNYGGNLYFCDKYGNTQPNYKEFNNRYELIWDSEYRI